MEKKKILGLDKNICFLLSWLIFIFGIIALAAEREKLTKNERQHFVSMIVVGALYTIIMIVLSIFSAIFFDINVIWYIIKVINWLLSLAFLALVIVAMVKSYQEEYWEVPVAFALAGKFVKDLPSDSKAEEAKEEAPAEETKEEAPAEENKEEAPAEEAKEE